MDLPAISESWSQEALVADAGTTVLDDLRERYDVPVLYPPIARSVRFAEAPALGRSALTTTPHLKGAESYRVHARNLLGR